VAGSLYQISQFYKAAEGENTGIVDRLLKQCISPDTKNASDETPIWKAADRGHQAVVHIIL
jgi:hypothetical protein